MQCHAIVTCWIRQAQHTHTSNPDTLKEKKVKAQEERKEEKREGNNMNILVIVLLVFTR